MIYLVASILLSVLLLVNFRLFGKFGINTAQAIGLNYTVCFLIGFLLIPAGQKFTLDLTQNWVWYCLALGVGFIITFILSGKSTQTVGLTATSMANNLSLVIPVLASLFLFNAHQKEFDFINYSGLLIALLSVSLATFKKEKTQINARNWTLPLSVFVLYGLTNSAINYLNLKYIPHPEQTVPITLIMVLGAQISGVCLVIYRFFKHSEKIELKNVLASITLGIPNFLSFYLLFLSLNAFGNSGAFVYPIYNMGVILVSALIGILFFKEELTKLNKLGLALAFLAIILISYQELGLA